MPEVNIVGTIQRASYLPPDCDASFCKWRVVAGPGWTLLDGSSQGQTQTSVVKDADNSAAAAAASFLLPGIASEGERSAVWEHPIDLHYGCATLSGWPQLVVTVWRQDSLQRNEISGYGSIRVPTSPGVHTLEIALWRPEGSWAQELAASFFGGGLPHLTDSTMVHNPTSGGRHTVASVSAGTVLIEVQVLMRGFGSHGVVSSAE